MHARLLTYLRCPACGGRLEAERADGHPPDGELDDGRLVCQSDSAHGFLVKGGIPRMSVDGSDDGRTRENFTQEWRYHAPGGRTWGMDLDDRVRWFFLEPLRIPAERFEGMVMLDAGCGNGSQSVAYSELGLEVIAMDLSSGLEHGIALFPHRPRARPDRVHFVQGDLQAPPLAPGSVDLIHSAGVLHHTPDTERTFRALCPLLRPGGTFYVWLYKQEPVVSWIIDGIRKVTTRLSPKTFDRLARAMAAPFQVFCAIVDAVGLRSYPRLSREEAALALTDIFGAPYAHAHTFDEVAKWYRSEGFNEVWACNDDRRGFGVCGRRPPSPDH